MNKKKVVLAYSGGLDTSYCVHHLAHEKSLDVYAVSVNTGGFSSDELKEMEKMAFQLGAYHFDALEAEQDYYQKIIKFLIFGNVLKNNNYPLSVGAERVLQAIMLVKYAQHIGADFIAHGSTGAGNDQVRFDVIFQILAPEIRILTPIRDQGLSREEEIEYLQNHGIQLNWYKAQYSINTGLWGTSIGGAETLTSDLPLPEEAFPVPLRKKNPLPIELHFEQGELNGVDTKKGSSVEMIQYLETIAAPYAIGRDIHVGDTLIGIKGRVGFAAASALLIIAAHQLLEKHTLSKWQLQHKDYIGKWYGTHLHEGQYLDPVMRDFEALLATSQQRVSGSVFITLHPYRFTLDGIKSDYDLLENTFAHYGETNSAWSANDVKGFIKLFSIPGKLYQSVTHN
ncbi:argininosuccinate synthase domain-containing protein [Mesonia aquimarina]|uniref:argininosuccinate synthase domain-containing protein n=1 Tax=Mesonia aquimarina TaxID=1504967 RepID=UPI000EF5D915|nr:argininosuccinate synthase domain-containing protein [Mesonia aquimarina]